MSDVDEIKQKLDIVQIVQEYIQMTQAGMNWKARCPFHDEKTPSFMVSQEKQIFHCFGCGKGGDIFTFVQEIEGMDFPEALRLLAKKAGVTLKQTDPRVHSQKTRVIDIHKWAAAYWQKVQQESKIAEQARNYLKKRGLSKETLMDFKIGYAPEGWDKMLNFLKSKKFTEAEINQAGLIKRKERSSGFYDRFRNRIIFPISDIHGTIIAFGGRAMSAEDSAKYLNSPQTIIYDKSFTVYGLDKAKQEIKEKDLAIFVEGYMDVISSHQAGVKNVIATSGTALTPGHIKFIKRYTNNVAFCFDQDLAGQNAAQRSIDIAIAEEMNIQIIKVLYGKDPDECIQQGVDLWKKSIQQAMPYMEFNIDLVKQKYDLSNIDHKKRAAIELLTQVVKIKSKIEQDYWIRHISELLSVSESLLWEAMPVQKTIIPTETGLVDISSEKNKDVYSLLFGLIITYPENIKYLSESLESKMILTAKWIEFYKKLIEWYNKNENISKTEFDKWLKLQDSEVFNQGFFDSLILYIQKEFDSFTEAQIQNEIISLVRKIKKDYFQKRIDELMKMIKQLETAKESKEKIDNLVKEFQELTWQISQLD